MPTTKRTTASTQRASRSLTRTAKTKPAKAKPGVRARPDYLALMPYAPLQGGVFAGLTYDSGVPEILIAGPEYDGEADWNAVVAWAKSLNVDGFTDFFLPLRSHGRILQANVPKLFQPSWYWLGIQHASYSDYAWSQGFGNGTQDRWSKVSKLRARAVRRSAI